MRTDTPTDRSIEDRLGMSWARRLDDGTRELPADIIERLRFSRERAVARAQAVQAQGRRSLAADRFPGVTTWSPAVAGTPQSAGWGAAGWPASGGLSGDPGWTGRVAAWLPLLILVLGFVLIQDLLQEVQIEAAAEVDAALLADDLPPQAYSDPGFAEFLRREAR